MSTEQCLLPLLVFIGFCQANGLPQGQLYYPYGDDGIPQRQLYSHYEDDGISQRQLYSPYEDGANAPQYAYQTQDEERRLQLDEDMIPPPGSDDNDGRKFLLLSHDKKPNSDKYKLSELAFFGLGPDAFVKKERDESGNGQTLSAGIEYFGMPLTQISSTNKKEQKEDGSTVDIQTLEKGYEFFGLPLGKIKYSNKKETNLYGEELPSDQKAEFELFGIPLAQIPLPGGGTEYKEYGNQEIVTGYYTTNQEQQEYQYSQNDFAVKPHLVPLGTVQGYEEGYYRQLVCPPSSSLNGRTLSQSDCEVRLIPIGTVLSYEGGYQQVTCPYSISPTGELLQSDCTVDSQSFPIGMPGGFEASFQRQVVQPPPKALKEHIVVSKHHQQIKTHPREQLNENQNSRRFLARKDDSDLQLEDGVEFLGSLTQLFADSVKGLTTLNDFMESFLPLMESFSIGRSRKGRPRKEAHRVKFRGPVIVG